MSSNAPHQALYRRWRAQTFGQIVGQKAVVETLVNGVRSGRTSHAYLFVGPRGTGKTSLARILAKALNCSNLRDGEPCDECPSCVAIREGRALDVTEMDAASNNRVDDMRDLLPRIFTVPSDMRRKVFIVDEVQRIKEGWDVLLKTLEEPPDHVVFVFCTTDSSSIRPAVLSRVQRFDFRRLTVPEITGKLRTILEADGRTAEPAAVELIAKLAAGGMRDAESMLDQLLSVDAGALTADRVREVLGLVETETVDAFLRALVGGDALLGIELLDDLEGRGRDLRAFADQAVEQLRTALVASMGRDGQAGLAAAGPAALADAARALSSIDPTHPGPGGLRLALELALLRPRDGREPGSLRQAVGWAPGEGDRSAKTPPPAVSPASPAATPAAPVAARPVHPATTPPVVRPATNQAPIATPYPAAGPARVPAAAPTAAEPAATPVGTAAHTPATAAEPAATPADSPGTAAAPAPTPVGTAAHTPATAAEPAATPATPPTARAATGTPATPPTVARPAGPAAAPPAGTRPGEAHIKPTLEMVLSRWPEIVAVVSKSPALKQLINTCRPIGVESSIVTLGFPENQSFLRDAADRKRQALEDGVGRVLGAPVNIRCVSANVEGSLPPADPDGSRLLDEFHRIFEGDIVDVKDVE